MAQRDVREPDVGLSDAAHAVGGEPFLTSSVWRGRIVWRRRRGVVATPLGGLVRPHLIEQTAYVSILLVK